MRHKLAIKLGSAATAAAVGVVSTMLMTHGGSGPSHLEACIRIEDGAVMAYKHPGSKWGKIERQSKWFKVMPVKDPERQEEITGKPFIVTPFFLAKDVITVSTNPVNPKQTITWTTTVIVTESTYKVNPEAATDKPIPIDSDDFNIDLTVENGKVKP